MWPFKRKKPSNDNKKEHIDVNKPVANTDLKLTLKDFNLNKSEQTLLKVLPEIKKANFLILIDSKGLKVSQTSEEGIVEIEAGSRLRFLKTYDEKKDAFMPLFTDWNEIDLFIKDRSSIKAWIMKADEAFQFVLKCNVHGLVINPCSDRWTMSKEQITNFLNEI